MPFTEIFQSLKTICVLAPHFVNTDIFKDYGLRKRHDILLMGAISNVYPLRKKMRLYFKGRKGFKYRPHPGYTNVGVDSYFGEKYAKEINRSKIFITDDSILHYPLIKYYEVLACKTLLLAPTSKEVEA